MGGLVCRLRARASNLGAVTISPNEVMFQHGECKLSLGRVIDSKLQNTRILLTSVCAAITSAGPDNVFSRGKKGWGLGYFHPH